MKAKEKEGRETDQKGETSEKRKTKRDIEEKDRQGGKRETQEWREKREKILRKDKYSHGGKGSTAHEAKHG